MKATRKSSKFPKSKLLADLAIALFGLISAVILALEFTYSLSPEQKQLIGRVDIAISLIFLSEFLWRLHKQDKKGHFLLLHWWEALAAIPVTASIAQVFRALNILRFLEVIRVVRTFARLELAGEATSSMTRYPYVIQAVSSLLAILFAASVLFYNAEYGINSNVRSLWDAFWWSGVTMTSTGYGDIYPVTNVGRIAGLILMFSGVIFFGIFTATFIRYMNDRKRK